MIIHKTRGRTGAAWCGVTEGDIQERWQNINCEKCFDAAIYGRKQMGKYSVPVDAIIRDQALSHKMLRKERGELK